MTENQQKAYDQVCHEIKQYILKITSDMIDCVYEFLPQDSLYYKDGNLKQNFIDIYFDRSHFTKYNLIDYGHVDKQIITEVLFSGWQYDKRSLKMLINRLVHNSYTFSLHSPHRND